MFIVEQSDEYWIVEDRTRLSKCHIVFLDISLCLSWIPFKILFIVAPLLLYRHCFLPPQHLHQQTLSHFNTHSHMYGLMPRKMEIQPPNMGVKIKVL